MLLFLFFELLHINTVNTIVFYHIFSQKPNNKLTESSIFTAKEIIGTGTMSVIDKGGKIRQAFFWYPDKEDKKKIAKLTKHNAFRYVQDFLPAFGFYKFRDPDGDEDKSPI